MKITKHAGRGLSLSEPLEYLVCDGSNLATVRLDDQIRNFPVHRIPYTHEILQYLPRIAVFEQRPAAATLGSRQLLVYRRVQVDDKTPTAQVAAVLRVDYSAATRREHDAFDLRQVVNDFGFSLTKSFFTFFLEYERNVDARTRFDFVITVHEVQVQHSRKLSADGRFACAHRADQKQVLWMSHIRDSLLCELLWCDIRGNQMICPRYEKANPRVGFRHDTAGKSLIDA